MGRDVGEEVRLAQCVKVLWHREGRLAFCPPVSKRNGGVDLAGIPEFRTKILMFKFQGKGKNISWMLYTPISREIIKPLSWAVSGCRQQSA